MVSPADRTCFRSITVESFAATEVVVAIAMSSREMVYVAALELELAITIFVTIAVVLVGTVYRVVDVEVVYLNIRLVPVLRVSNLVHTTEHIPSRLRENHTIVIEVGE